MGIKLLFSPLVVYCTLCLLASAVPLDDKHALLEFIRNTSDSTRLNWDERSSVCDRWIGVTCSHDHSRVIALELPAVGFKCRFPSNTLGRLSSLEILDLRSNGFSGPFPSDFLKLKNLTCLYLESNFFEGPLPLDFSVWEKLSCLNLSNNRFSGMIPSSILNLTHLVSLDLDNNSLYGDGSDFNVPSLKVLDLSDNSLTGLVSKCLQNSSSLPSAVDNHLPSKSTHLAIILAIAFGGSAMLLAIGLLLILAYVRRKCCRTERATDGVCSQRDREGGRVTFFESSTDAFELEDLLTASSHLLGKGTFGTTYKASLDDVSTLAVKRLNKVVVGRKDFEQQMEAVGSIKHENVAPLRAYYYSKYEKILVYDFFDQGSVSNLLHGRKKGSLDWERRLNIAIGVAKGLAHIHSQYNGMLVHGNVKSSNIFLNQEEYGCVCELGLEALVGPIRSTRSGYRAPEVKVTQASDVYSYGVVLLELLTGRSPNSTMGSGFVWWVKSMVNEEWTGEVFDMKVLENPNVEGEMVAMLRIGLSCVAERPEERPEMVEVMRMVEEIRYESLFE